MKLAVFLISTLGALVVAAPLHASSPPSGSGMMVDNIPTNNALPGGGIGSSSYLVSDRALANALPDTSDSSAYYDAAAEQEAEELVLVLDATRDSVAEDGVADENVKMKRRREGRARRDVG